MEYMITFGFSATNQRCIWKRFSDFHTLYKALGKTNKRIKNYKDFPKKSIQKTGANSDAFNKERCSKLDIFMKLVVSIDPIPPELSEWIRLSVPNPVANSARLASTVESISGSGGGSSSDLLADSRNREINGQQDGLSPQQQLALQTAAREAELKLQLEAEEMAAIQQAVRDRSSLSMDENDYIDGREVDSIDGGVHGGISPSKSSGRNRLGSLQDKIASKLGAGGSGDNNKKMEPTFNTQQVDAKVNAAVKRVQETHQDAMKVKYIYIMIVRLFLLLFTSDILSFLLNTITFSC